mgnify:FL=1
MISRRALLPLAAAFAAPALPAFAAPPRTVQLGPHSKQALDLYPTPGLKDAPVLLFVHGGGWSLGDKGAVNALPGYAARHGFLLASAGYRLAPEVDAGGCAEDVALSIAWLSENAARNGGDPQRIVIAGHSAGAHLVALVGADPRYLGDHGRSSKDLAGVICIDGAGYDAPRQMAQLAEGGGGPLQRRLASMYQGAFGARAAELSPTRLVEAGRAYPPFLIFHVERRADAREQSDGLAAALRAAGGSAEVVSARGETHRSINVDFGKPGDPEGERAALFIRS